MWSLQDNALVLRHGGSQDGAQGSSPGGLALGTEHRLRGHRVPEHRLRGHRVLEHRGREHKGRGAKTGRAQGTGHRARGARRKRATGTGVHKGASTAQFAKKGGRG